MESTGRKLLQIAILACALAAPGVGAAREKGREHGREHDQHPYAVPEFSAISIGTIATLVAGGGLLIARRRRR